MLKEIPYGDSSLPLEYDPQRTKILAVDELSALTDVEIGEAFDNPIDSPPLDEIVRPGENVLIVVPDATRRAAAGQIVNLLVRRLIAGGTLPYDISIIFATGIHRPATPEEKAEIVTPFIAQRVKMLDHAPRDLMRIAGVGDQNRLVQVGEFRDGLPIELDRVLLDYDRTIIVGGVNFHYFAGFGGGRKLICPGLASAATTAATHRLAFDFEKLDRAVGVETGRLDGNPVHEAFVEAVKHAPPS
ncbi:MAG TPA: lactate racemase domain-containing protein, partial [Pyrinomonadaceae bacterium]|nr:lactate racemase domain-containing protein [Pyrinomonadaceae bacterium]